MANTSNIASLLAEANRKRVASGKEAAPAPAPKPDAKLAWDNVSPDDLPPDVQTLYHAIGKARSAFETAMSEMLEPPAHLRLVFSYKRGLAIALADKQAAGSGLAGLLARISAAD